jgi:hypothetical protein
MEIIPTIAPTSPHDPPPELPLNHEYEVTQGDVFWLQLYLLTRSKMLLISMLIMLVLLAGNAVYEEAKQGRPPIVLVLLGILMIAIGVSVWGILTIMMLCLGPMRKEAAKLQGRYQLAVLAEGLSVSNPRGHTLYYWNNLEKLVESRRALILLAGPSSGFAIPKRSFANLTAQRNFASRLRARIAAARA